MSNAKVRVAILLRYKSYAIQYINESGRRTENRGARKFGGCRDSASIPVPMVCMYKHSFLK